MSNTTDSEPGKKNTPEGVAAMRFVIAGESDPALRGDDYLAKKFLGLKYRILAGPLRALTKRIYRRKLPGLYEWIMARSKYYDGLFRSAAERNLKQIVLVGAGYDTRALRFQAELNAAGIRVFEMDLPSVQERKKSIMGPNPPGHITFVGADFNRRTLDEMLPEAGFQVGTPSLFICEGVVSYLEHDAVDRLLASMRAMGGAKSVIAFDYCPTSMVDGSGNHYGGEELRKYLIETGEPLIWAIEPDEAEEWLKKRKYRLVQQLGPEELEQRWLKKSDGTLFARSAGYEFIIEAEAR